MILEGTGGTMLAKGAALHVFFLGGLPFRFNVTDVTSGLQHQGYEACFQPFLSLSEHACTAC